jgi:hypothetical protein
MVASPEYLKIGGTQVAPLRKFQNFHGQIYCRMWKKYGAYPGVQTPLTLDELGVLDGGNWVEGLGAIGLALGCLVRRVD